MFILVTTYKGETLAVRAEDIETMVTVEHCTELTLNNVKRGDWNIRETPQEVRDLIITEELRLMKVFGKAHII
jgi:hypothetical protein